MKSRDGVLAGLAGTALVVSLGYLLLRALGGANRLVDRDIVGRGEAGETFAAAPWLIVAAVAAAVALIGWILALRRLSQGSASADDRTLARLRHAAEEQRRWSRKLAEKLNELHRSQGPLGGRDDVRSLVLRVAIELLGAEKGLLLSRRDDDNDGRLDLVAAEGFSSDPERSKLAQRFAEEVIERDTIVRIGRQDMPDESAERADREIDNLVAIPIYISDDFEGVVVCVNGEALEHEDEVLVALGDHAGAILENSKLHGHLRSSYVATVKMLADALEVKDPFLRGHSDEVSGLTEAMARRLNLEGERREQLVFGSLLHDVGKIGVSERILLKPGPLTDEEFAAVKLHPRIGYRLVAQLPLLKGVAPAILHHHERYDGGGYPAGLVGERIPLEARVIAIIDAFSAMISDRPYQAAIPVEGALAELERCAGTHFDPHLVTIFVEEVRGGVLDRGERSTPLSEALDDPELASLRETLSGATFASTDSQTLLHSHGAFRERLSAEIARADLRDPSDRLHLIVIELTNLGELNRDLGYSAVDELLEELGRGVEAVVSPEGGIAGREAGARIAVLLPDGDPAGIPDLSARLAAAAPERLEMVVGSAAHQRSASAGDLIERATPLAA